jgi:F0F1-type ATP synthase membrane subunit b/b'
MEEMRDWLMHQLFNFNFLTIIVMVTFVTTFSKANTNKLLKEQSSEIYNEIEEVKQEIWRANSQGRNS